MERLFRITLGMLIQEWGWEKLSKRSSIKNLIFTKDGRYRQDNKTPRLVGQPKVKFKFKYGWPPHEQRCFIIAPLGNARFIWKSTVCGRMIIEQRVGGNITETIEILDLFEDPLNPSDKELELMEFLYPGLTEELPRILPGLHGLDREFLHKS